MTDFLDELETSPFTLSDLMRMETDRRKIEQMLNDGVITPEQLANAKVVEIQPTCECEQGIAFYEDEIPRCPACHAPGVEIEQ